MDFLAFLVDELWKKWKNKLHEF